MPAALEIQLHDTDPGPLKEKQEDSAHSRQCYNSADGHFQLLGLHTTVSMTSSDANI